MAAAVAMGQPVLRVDALIDRVVFHPRADRDQLACTLSDAGVFGLNVPVPSRPQPLDPSLVPTPKALTNTRQVRSASFV